MNYSSLVPDRELCEEMARLGICQDKPEICYMNCQDDFNKSWILINGIPPVEHIIAPTLPRMLEELPSGYCVRKGWGGSKDWFVFNNEADVITNLSEIPNAVAKALIKLEKKG